MTFPTSPKGEPLNQNTTMEPGEKGPASTTNASEPAGSAEVQPVMSPSKNSGSDIIVAAASAGEASSMKETIPKKSLTPSEPENISSIPVSTSNNESSTSATNAVPTDSQEKNKLEKISALLAHRRLLLKRVQQCQKVSQERLKSYETAAAAVAENSQESTTTASTTSAQGGNSTSPPPPTPDFRLPQIFPTTQSEVSHYQALCSHALSYNTKRPSSTQPVVGTATTSATAARPSLRKGASVGKKMQAAVASLTSGGTGNWSSDGNGGTTAGSVPPAASAGTKAPKAEVPRSTSSPIPPTGTAVVASTVSSSPPPPTRSPSLPVTAPSTEASQGKTLKRKPKTKRPSKKNAMSSSTEGATPAPHGPLHSNMGDASEVWNAGWTTQLPPPSVGEYFYGSGGPPPPPGSMALATGIPSRSFCPELLRLRNRKKELLDRLHQLEGETTNSMGGSVDGSRNIDCHVAANASFLPPRRKTQWDYVLEEMRWLATDFVEERKWKMAGARTIAGAVSNRAVERLRSPKRRPPSISEREKPPPPAQPKGLVTGDRVDSSSLEMESEVVPMETDQEVSSDIHVITPELEVGSKHFEDPTKEEMEDCRKVSKQLGEVVLAHWDSVGAKDGDSLQISDTKISSSCLEFFKSKQELEGLISEKDEPEELMTEVSAIAGDQLSFDEMLENISTILEWTSKVKSDIGEGQHENGHEFNIKPCDSQRESLKFIEKLWSDKTKLTPGVILKGSFGSGKTVLAGLLAQMRRKAGPQLILCPSQSVVSY